MSGMRRLVGVWVGTIYDNTKDRVRGPEALGAGRVVAWAWRGKGRL